MFYKFMIFLSAPSRMRQILHPLIFPKMIERPRNFSNLINTGTRVYDNHRPVEPVSSKRSKWNRDSPHCYGKAVHIKHCITAGTKHAIDGNFVDGAANHIDAEHNKHSL